MSSFPTRGGVIFPVLATGLAVAAEALLWLSASSPIQEIPGWHIQGELSEACTCSVPCTCNFGESPSPHDYCWAMWSYWVREGKFGEIDLAGVRIGGVEGESGTLGLLDVRATPEQRSAMQQIWHALSGRLLCHVRLWPHKVGPNSLESDGARQGSIIRTRYTDPRFLGFDFVEIEQIITQKMVRLRFGDRGGFEADYIFGRNPEEPIRVKNIVSWPIAETIKGRTVYLRYKDRFNELDYRNTNANQGSFNLTDGEAGAQPMTAPK